MDNQEYYYLGFLANVDSSILSVKLDHDFIMESMSVDQYVDFISDIKKDDLHYGIAREVLSHEYPIINFDEKKIYFIKNTAEKYRQKSDYLPKILTLLRLFAEGNIQIPVQFQTAPIKENKLISVFSAQYGPKSIKPAPKYTLKDQDVKILNAFIKTVKIPFEKSYLQLALDNLERSYEMSYGPHHDNLSFLTLMIGFEAIFNLGNAGITQTISRHTAVLISKNKTECKTIYSDMKNFYKQRSFIVHAAKTEKFKNTDQKDISKLRNYLRECIKKAFELNYDKDELFEYLNLKGF